jgi:hypothetical protein
VLGIVSGNHLRSIEGLLPTPFDRSYSGVVVQMDVAGTLGVNVLGNVLPARWFDPVVVVVGDPVLVQISVGKNGGAEAIVRNRIASRPRPANGTVTATPGGGYVTILGANGVTYDAIYVASYTPTIGDTVILSWPASQPVVLGHTTIPATSPLYPSPFAPPPPPPATTGATTYAATSSDTYWPGHGWSLWNSGNKGVFQGGTDQLTGCWYYSGSIGQLADRTIDRIQFQIGERLSVFGSDKQAVVHFYTHDDPSRPPGAPVIANGPYDVVATIGQGLTTYDLPPAQFANALQGGGGIAIYGSPYCGFKAVKDQPDSGKLIIDWSL